MISVVGHVLDETHSRSGDTDHRFLQEEEESEKASNIRSTHTPGIIKCHSGTTVSLEVAMHSYYRSKGDLFVHRKSSRQDTCFPHSNEGKSFNIELLLTLLMHYRNWSQIFPLFKQDTSFAPVGPPSSVRRDVPSVAVETVFCPHKVLIGGVHELWFCTYI